MSRLRTSEQADRVLRFIHGLRNTCIATQLAQFGFSQKDLDRGWTLMRQSVGERLLAAPNRVADPRTLDLLDSWENIWFSVAQATLAYEYPAVEQKVFLNIGQTSGVELIITVGTFVDRFEALASGTEEEKAAHALLVGRGFDERTVKQAKDLLLELASISRAWRPRSAAAKTPRAQTHYPDRQHSWGRRCDPRDWSRLGVALR